MAKTPFQFGVSYFGVRNPEHVQHDLKAIASLGFDYVVFTFSENDHRFYQHSMAACVWHAQQQGLKAYIDPWGVCGIFGGEAFTERGAWDLDGQQRRSDGRSLPLLCPTSKEVRAYLRTWITTVAESLHADGIFWDEPHFYLPSKEGRRQGLWGCCCHRCQEGFASMYGYPMPDRETAAVQQWKHKAIVSLLRELTAQAAAYNLRNTVCVLPTPMQLDALAAKLDDFATDPHLDVLATDPYPLYHQRPIATTRLFCETLLRVCQRHGKAAQMWIQGFLVPEGQEPLLAQEMRLMATCGIRDIAVWSYLATAYMSSHACARPERAWAVITRTMHFLRQGHILQE